MNKGERQVEGSFHDSRRVIQTNGNIIWAYELPSDISNNYK